VSNTAVDHIDVFEAALDQLGALPDTVRLLVRADTAGCTHDFLGYLRQAGVGFSVGYAITAPVRSAIRALDEDAWTPALTQDGDVREGAAVAELTGTLDLAGWPPRTRVLVRREPLHPGAQQTLTDVDGCRFTALLTDQPEADLALLEQRHRARARVEDRIRGAKDTGARNLPCDTFARNAVWPAARPGRPGHHDLPAGPHPRRRTAPGRTGDAALPAAARPRPPRALRTRLDTAHPTRLALGPTARRRLHPPAQPATTGRLTVDRVRWSLPTHFTTATPAAAGSACPDTPPGGLQPKPTPSPRRPVGLPAPYIARRPALIK
jgi:hypothetical protein